MKILIVEDTFVHRTVLYNYIKPYGHCGIAKDGNEAMLAFRNALVQGEPFDLICLDIVLPELDGISVLQQIRKIEKDKHIEKNKLAKIIMTSSLNEKKTVVEAIQAQCDGYLVKPFEKEELLELLKKLGLLDKQKVKSTIEFANTIAKRVMVPKTNIIAVEKTISVDEIIDIFKKEGHSCIPVYDTKIDNILGIIYEKDLFKFIFENDKNNLSITKILRKAYFVPETKNISEMLTVFKKAEAQIVIVIDENGNTAGIVSFEDLFKEIVGEIKDKYNQDELDYVWINETTLLIDTGISIDKINEIIRTDIPSEKFDTFERFIYDQLKFNPEGEEEVKQEDISLNIKGVNISLSIKGIIENRISKVLVKLDKSDKK